MSTKSWGPAIQRTAALLALLLLVSALLWLLLAPASPSKLAAASKRGVQ